MEPIKSENEIRIYVACLAAYNIGCLHGVWIDATADIDDIQDQINSMLESSPAKDAEEYAIHDFEGYGSYHLSEYDGIKSAHEIACFIEEYGDIGAELISQAFSTLEEAQKAMEEDYRGVYVSLADFAQELTEETSEVPSHLEFYIDYESMARDMEMSGDIFTIETGYQEVHVFLTQ